jgi:signal transduction histidine kinase
MRVAPIAGFLLALFLPARVRGADTKDLAVHVLARGDFVLSDSPSPPPDDAPWKPVTLPDNWFASHPGEARAGWYRLAFQMDPQSADSPHTLYLPRNGAKRMRFFFNGMLQGGNLGYGDPGARTWAPPLALLVPPRLLRPGGNVLHVRVVAVPGLRQGLARVVLLEGQAGRVPYEIRYAIQIMTLYMFGAAALLCALLAAGFWLRQRGDAVLLWLAITAFTWAAAAFPGLHGAFTPREFFHGPLAFGVRFAYVAPMLVLCLRVAGKRWPLREGALWVFTALGLVLAWCFGENRQGALITCWSVTYLGALVALLVVLVRSRKRQREWAFWPLAAALVVAILLNAHDLAWWMGWIDYESFQLAHFHVPLVLVAIGANLVDRHFQAVAAVERAKGELEGRVAEKAREIEASYAKVEEAEREKALAGERKRIMADMHDGLGSSLLGLLGAVQSGRASLPEVERRLHDALQELRLAVDALGSTDGDLNVILGNVRHRMRVAIESSGVDFRWQVGELPQLSSLSPRSVLAIQRIVLEALTNSLRHAGARLVAVTTRLDGSWLQIGVADDGIGFDEASIVPGRGLESLRRRARGLGGTVEIRSSRGGGTSVTLRLPFEGADGAGVEATDGTASGC